MVLQVINSRGWDGGGGSQTPVHQDTTGTLKEPKTGPVMSPRVWGIQLSSGWCREC